MRQLIRQINKIVQEIVLDDENRTEIFREINAESISGEIS